MGGGACVLATVMSKPKSTVIEMDAGKIVDITLVSENYVERVAVPGRYKVWREGGEVFLEVFHNG